MFCFFLALTIYNNLYFEYIKFHIKMVMNDFRDLCLKIILSEYISLKKRANFC